MQNDPVEVLEQMSTRAAVALRVADGELRELHRRGSQDPLAHARADVRRRLALAAATIGLRWLSTLDAQGLVDERRRLKIEEAFRRVLGADSHPDEVMVRTPSGPYSQPDTVPVPVRYSPETTREETLGAGRR